MFFPQFIKKISSSWVKYGHIFKGPAGLCNYVFLIYDILILLVWVFKNPFCFALFNNLLLT